MTKLKSMLDQVIKSLETKQWVICPLCREEWNRLRLCSYLQNGQTVQTYVCVQCAESPQSIQKVFDLLRIKAVISPLERKKPYDDLYRSYGDKYDSPYVFKCRVESVDPIITLWIQSDGPRLETTYVEGKSTIRFDNVFQCASYFSKLLNEILARKPKNDSSWLSVFIPMALSLAQIWRK